MRDSNAARAADYDRIAEMWHQTGEPAPSERVWRDGRDVSLEHPSTWPAWFDRHNYVVNGWRPWLRPSERDQVWPDPSTVLIGERSVRSRGGRRSRIGRG